MATITLKMMEIGLLATHLIHAEKEVKRCKKALESGYIAHKEDQGILSDPVYDDDGVLVCYLHHGRIVEHSPQWELMMEATKPQYEALKKAKSDLRNIKRKLERAVARME